MILTFEPASVRAAEACWCAYHDRRPVVLGGVHWLLDSWEFGRRLTFKAHQVPADLFAWTADGHALDLDGLADETGG